MFSFIIRSGPPNSQQTEFYHKFPDIARNNTELITMPKVFKLRPNNHIMIFQAIDAFFP